MRNVKPKKHLGQHFLKDENIARKIVACLPTDTEAQIVEIGPGKGVLTQFLLKDPRPVLAVEFDGEAVEFLKETYGQTSLELHHADFLKWKMEQFLRGPAHFIGNLPYNVSSPIFFRLLHHLSWVRSGTFMVQKEVAQRICAPPGSREYGILSVLLGYYFDLKYQFSVAPQVFFPPPKVTSGVFTMLRKQTQDEISPAQLIPLVKAAFGKRRKTLRNALAGFEFAEFEGKDLLLDKRAEQLAISEFAHLIHVLKSEPTHPYLRQNKKSRKHE